jgi:hypothetical protein
MARATAKALHKTTGTHCGRLAKLGRVMKWYLGITEATFPDYADVIGAAINSAKIFTDLRPHVLFDGRPGRASAFLEQAGATIVYNRISFENQIKAAQEFHFPGWSHYMQTALGAFQRLDIPVVETEEEFVLYTDCDIEPEIFAVAPQFHKDGHKKFEINSGVMVINVPRMRRDLDAIIELGCEIIDDERLGYDQEFLEKFYRGKWDPLPLRYNWKPYWGVNHEARIVHWHGPKPAVVAGLLKSRDYPTNDIHRDLFLTNPESYAYYLKKWREFEP